MIPGLETFVCARPVSAHRFEDDGRIPNNPRLPLVIYPAALDLLQGDPAILLEERFRRHGWRGCWRNGIFAFPHYHSTAHEVLGVASGEANVRFGGSAGFETTVGAGDVVVIPARVGHQNLGSCAEFLVVGAYPDGQTWDLCRGTTDERPRVLRNIEGVALPANDPVFGEEGPLLSLWR